MEPETGDIRLEMMTAADMALSVIVRKIRLLPSFILPARDFWKTVLAGLLFQLLHSSVEWALEISRKPVPLDPWVAEELLTWKRAAPTTSRRTGSSQVHGRGVSSLTVQTPS